MGEKELLSISFLYSAFLLWLWIDNNVAFSTKEDTRKENKRVAARSLVNQRQMGTSALVVKSRKKKSLGGGTTTSIPFQLNFKYYYDYLNFYI